MNKNQTRSQIQINQFLLCVTPPNGCSTNTFTEWFKQNEPYLSEIKTIHTSRN